MKGGTIKERENFSEPDADKLGQRLRKSMKGIGTDERVIIEILTKHATSERKTIADRYKVQFGRDLKADLKSELGGNFENAVLALCEWDNHYLAEWAHRAIRGLGTDEKTLIEILCGNDSDMLQMVDSAYDMKYNRSLEADIESEMSGHVKNLMVALLQWGRDDPEEKPPSKERAKELAQELYEAGEGMNGGTDEDTFIRILSTTSYPQLRMTFDEYTVFAENTLDKAIEKEFSGLSADALNTVVRCVRDQPAYFAKELHDAMKGPGTDDDTLIRILVTRSEIDLEDIKDAFKKMYKKTLSQAVKEESSGDYQKILMAIIK